MTSVRDNIQTAWMMNTVLLLIACCCLFCAPVGADSFEDLDRRVSSIKSDVIDLGKDMRIFERLAIYPDDKRLSVFLTLDVGKFFKLDRFKIQIDDATVISRDFHHHETEGLQNGAAVRVYVGNLDEGPHKLLAFFEGEGTRNRRYKRGVRHRFVKKTDSVFIEMRASDSEKRLQPEFLVKEW